MAKFKFYKPKIRLIVTDIFIILGNIVTVFLLLPLTTKTPFTKYAIPALIFTVAWIVTSYFFRRYKSLKTQPFLKIIFRLFYTSLISFAVFGGFILLQPASPYSQNVLITVLTGVFVVEYLFAFVFFAYNYATQYDVPKLYPEKRETTQVPDNYMLSKDAVNERKDRITDFTGEKAFEYLNKNTDLNSSTTHLLTELKITELKKIETFKYTTYIQLRKLNNLREINKMLSLINDKLPDNGLIVCCYKSQSTTKQTVFKTHPKAVAYAVYTSYFVVHRILPKFFLTKRLYYDLTQGKKRVFSKTEVLGRLNYCGFEVVKQAKIDHLNYVVAKRVRNSEPLTQRYYGPLIKLKRCGENGKMFTVYKFRTMHPYAEFLQSYVYQQNSLAEGGKFKRDIRITTLGHFMRKYWLDELPMFINLLKGDMKLIGVRPLSQHYFSLYSNELQEQRIKFKPGLLPPFYADMPKTLDEIQASETKYLTECENVGQFRTDVKYFFLIVKNILFKKARSA